MRTRLLIALAMIALGLALTPCFMLAYQLDRTTQTE